MKFNLKIEENLLVIKSGTLILLEIYIHKTDSNELQNLIEKYEIENLIIEEWGLKPEIKNLNDKKVIKNVENKNSISWAEIIDKTLIKEETK